MNKQVIAVIVIGLILTVGIGVSVYLVRQNQDTRSHASEFLAGNSTVTPTTALGAAGATATPACQVPQATQNVHINYPHCVGPLPCTVDLTKADCTWDAVTDATSYTIKISQVGNNNTLTPIKSDTVTGATTYTFDVVKNNTYECSVSPVNSCGEGTANAISLLCAAGDTSTVVDTPVPIATIVPTVPFPTAVPPIKNLPPTGSTITSILGIGGAALIMVGGALLLGI